ncbi:hypothetical protein SLEP1_g47584 [Rubroshorea leprosula]|uniref:Uncharacterized protein n=1 Tax=Rubroshorea leprosula TaxID=152421 RepID=A0AAV5LRS6_9ROSI|nr:hypothetical protein SLEP1_g47584 [Rubroshorea leprosula]
MLRFHQAILFFSALALLSMDISAEKYMIELCIDESAVNQSEQVTDQSTVTQSEQIAGQPTVTQSEQIAGQPTVTQLKQVADQPTVTQSEQVAGQSTVNQSEQVTDQPTVTESEQVAGQPTVNQSKRVITAWLVIAALAGAVLGALLMPSLPTSAQLFISAFWVGIGWILVFYDSKLYEVSSGDHEGENHELRPLLKLLPLWAPFLIFYVVDAAGSAFFDNRASLDMIQKFSGIIVSCLIDSVIVMFCGEVNQQVQQRIRLAKIIFGMLVCSLFCIDARHVQDKRKSEGLFTFTRQRILLGIMNEMVKEMLGEYFRDQVPDQSMHHLEFTFNRFVEGMGRLLAVVCILVFRNWIGETVNNGHLDKYFQTLAVTNLCALLMLLSLPNTWYCIKEAEDHDNDLENLEEGRRSYSLESQYCSARSSSVSQYFSARSSSVSQSSVDFSSDESISASSEATVLPNLESAESSHWSILYRGYA